MQRGGNAALITVIIAAFVLVLGGYVAWQRFRTPSLPPVPTTATASLALAQAQCGNWEYRDPMNPDQTTWTNKQSCTDALQAKDGKTFEIKQKTTGQSVAQLSFSLPSNIDESKIVSLQGEIIGTCRRQFEIKTLTQYRQWKRLPNMQCPPDYLNDVDYTFTPDIHNGTVGILIVSGDNSNDLIMDQVSVKATYRVSTSTAQ